MSEIIEKLRRLQCSDTACGDLRIAMVAKLAIHEIERLTTERDEARRDICCLHQLTGFLAGDFAIEQKWDCFTGGCANYGFSSIVNNYKATLDSLFQQKENRINELETQLRLIRAGFEGCCHACEPVGALNQELRDENTKLRRHMRSLQNYVLDRIVERDEELGLL